MKLETHREIQEQIADKIALMMGVIALPALFFSLLRYFRIGWSDVFYSHIILSVLFIFFALRRKRIPYNIKIIYFLTVFYLLAISGGLSLGLNSFLIEFLTICVFIAATFQSRKYAIVVYFISTATIIAIGILFVNRVIQERGFENIYSTFSVSWINAVSGFSLLTALVILIAGDIGHILAKVMLQLQILAEIDYLTGILNRMAFLELAEKEIAKCERYGQKLSLLMMDLDQFKKINDRYGHQEGDVVLVDVINLVKTNIRKGDILSRIGGEEFVILTPNTDLNQALPVAENIRKLIEVNPVGTEKTKQITASIGVAEYAGGDSINDLMKKSDDALYRAKQKGRNCVSLVD